MATIDNKQAFNKLRFKKSRFVIYRVNGIEVECEYISTRTELVKDMKRKLDDLRAALIIYDYEFTTKDGRRSDKMFLFSYIPENCTPVDRISTSHAIKAFHDSCDGTILQEVEDLDDFDNHITAEDPDPTRMK